MVMFGVTGDLARKKLMPALYDLANRGLLPPGFSLVGFARRDWEHEDFAPDHLRRRSRSTRARRSARPSGSSCRRACGSSPASSPTTRRSTSSPQTVRQLDAERGTGGNYAFYLSIPPKFFPTVVEQLKRSGLSDPGPARRRRARAVAAGGDREAVRPRPGDRQGAQRHRRRGVPRPTRCSASTTTWARRPSRTSWRCASPTRLYEPIWNRGVRGPRADHHVGGHRDRRPGRLLRRDRRRARRHPEPPAAAPRADRDGGAGVVRRRLAAPGEGEDALRRPAARRPRRSAPRAASTRPAGRAAAR